MTVKSTNVYKPASKGFVTRALEEIARQKAEEERQTRLCKNDNPENTIKGKEE